MYKTINFHIYPFTFSTLKYIIILKLFCEIYIYYYILAILLYYIIYINIRINNYNKIINHISIINRKFSENDIEKISRISNS